MNRHFAAICRVGAPDLRYSAQEMINGLQIELISKQKSLPKQIQAKHTQHKNSDAVYIPYLEDNSIIRALYQHGLYKASLGDGKHDITCPWKDEHTDAVDNGTAYFEPNDNWPIGGFKCLHGHCSNRHVRDLLHFIDIDETTARMKPVIRIISGEIHRIVDAAERELANTKKYYQRGGLIATVYSDPYTRETRIQPVTQLALVRALAIAATWERFNVRSNSSISTDPPNRHAGVLFDPK